MSRWKRNFQEWIQSMRSVQGIICWVCVFILFLSISNHMDGLFSYKTDAPTSRNPVRMGNGIVYSQELPEITDDIRAVRIRFGTYTRHNEGFLTVRLVEDDRTIKTWKLNTVDLVDNAYQVFETGRTLHRHPEKSLKIEILDEYEPETENFIAFYASLGGVSGA